MPSRKRKPTPETNTLEPKRQKASLEQPAADRDPVDLAARNAMQSPLLRLPAELRNMIWRQLYGPEKTLLLRWEDVQSEGGKPRKQIVFDVLENVQNLDGHQQIRSSVSASGHLPTLVCKQMWTETSQMFFSLTVLSVRWLANLRVLAQSHEYKTLVSRIQRIKFVSTACQYKEQWGWNNAIGDPVRRSTLRKYVSLRGIHWEINFCGDRAATTSNTNFHQVWKELKLSRALRVLQRHKLSDDVTVVDCWLGHLDCLHDQLWTKMSRKIRRRLLKSLP